jgi:hypothetical protein
MAIVGRVFFFWRWFYFSFYLGEQEFQIEIRLQQ